MAAPRFLADIAGRTTPPTDAEIARLSDGATLVALLSPALRAPLAR